MARLRDGLASMGSGNVQESRTLVFGSTFRTCAICLDEYNVGDRLRVLDSCGHCFHRACIDTWTKRRPSCPVCTASTNEPPSPTPVHTPTTPTTVTRVPRVQLIDLSVHDSWLEWLAKLVNRRTSLSNQDNPPLSLAAVTL